MQATDHLGYTLLFRTWRWEVPRSGTAIVGFRKASLPKGGRRIRKEGSVGGVSQHTVVLCTWEIPNAGTTAARASLAENLVEK